MPRNPKTFISGTLIELSSRIEEGLPFTPNILIQTLLINALARSQSFYPITIVNFVLMGNHFHMIVIVQDPKDVSDFMEYFKREMGYYVNRLLGRRKHTVWCEGFDSPVILDSEKAIERLKYTYLNPVQSDLCKRSKNWPLSSLNLPNEVVVKRIPRDKVPKVPNRNMSQIEIEKLHLKLQYRGKETFTLKVEPDAWIECFTETKGRDFKKLNDYLFSEIRKEEDRIAKNREFPITPLRKLATQNIRHPYQPEKFGKKTICLGSTKERRIRFLDWYKTLCKDLPRFLKKSKDEVMHRTHYPPGFSL
jgi:REP element-mobilizing transposase RayT